MKSHRELSDADFAAQFENCTLIPQLFNHEAHLRLAWIHIKQHGVDRAADNLCSQIKTFDKTFDDGTKFNTTVTVAAVKAVHHFMQRSSTTDFPAFIAENQQLINNFKGLIATHYSIDVFSAPHAKHTFIEPDLMDNVHHIQHKLPHCTRVHKKKKAAPRPPFPSPSISRQPSEIVLQADRNDIDVGF
ncbi:MAG: hypothetical protein AAF564_19305 [Bacteroidota bacterium]